MTITEAFESLENRCARIGMMTKDGEIVPVDIVMAKVGKRFPEDDEMLWAGIQNGSLTPLQFERSYMSLILQFNVEYKMKIAMKHIREIAFEIEPRGEAV